MTNEKEKLSFLQQYFTPLAFLLVVILLVGAYFLLWTAQINKITSNNKELINGKKEQLATGQKVLAELKAINEVYQSIGGELREKVKKILPNSPELSNLYYSLDNIAQSFGFKVTAVTINAVKNKVVATEPVAGVNTAQTKEVSNKKTAQLLEVNVVIEGGGYQNVKNYITALTHNLRLFDVKTLSYSPKDIDLSLSFKTYYTE